MGIIPHFPPNEYLLAFMMKAHSLPAELLFQQPFVDGDEIATAFSTRGLNFPSGCRLAEADPGLCFANLKDDPLAKEKIERLIICRNGRRVQKEFEKWQVSAILLATRTGEAY